MSIPPQELLSLCDINVDFTTDKGDFTAVSQMNFTVHAGETFCLVGESGCGKSLTAKALLRLLPENATVRGQAFLNGVDILSLPPKQMRKIRGQHIGMVFQEPMTALNPVLRVGYQVIETLRLHKTLSEQEAKEFCIELFTQVGIPAPQSRLEDYPHQLSGGMRQRVMIAMALACEPQLLIADEPTTALDVTLQWQILELIQKLATERGMGVLLITHDLGVVAQVAQKVGVMYAGQLVECGKVTNVLEQSLHPYTQGLLLSAPSRLSMEQERLPIIAGTVPPPYNLPKGCPFHPRCPKAIQRCQEEIPLLTGLPHNTHQVRCWLAVR